MDELRTVGSRTLGENIGFYAKSGWTFESFFEKGMLVLLSLMGMWKILDIVRWLF